MRWFGHGAKAFKAPPRFFNHRGHARHSANFLESVHVCVAVGLSVGTMHLLMQFVKVRALNKVRQVRCFEESTN